MMRLGIWLSRTLCHSVLIRGINGNICRHKMVGAVSRCIPALLISRLVVFGTTLFWLRWTQQHRELILGSPSGLIPDTPPSLAAGFSSSRLVGDQQLLIEALLLRLNQQNKVIKEQADVVGKLVVSAGSESNDDVSQQQYWEHQAATTHSLMEPTSPELHNTDATPMLVLQPKSYGLKLSPSTWHNTMMDILSPWPANANKPLRFCAWTSLLLQILYLFRPTI